MFLSLKTLYRKRTVIWPFYFYTIIRTLSFLGFSALMFILIGCSNKDNLQENKKSSAVEQTANLTAATPIQSLDPATAVDQTSITLLANVMEGLYRLDGSVAKF